jgi:iron(III) transport system permease protein
VIEATINTTVASIITAFVATAVVLPVAYLAVRHRSFIGSASNAVVTSTFALPGLLIALALFFFASRTPVVREVLGGTIALLIFAYVIHFGAQSLTAARVAVGSVPSRVEDAARTLGAGRVRRFISVHLPIMTPGLLAGAGLVLLSTMKELPISLLVSPIGFSTLTTKTFQSFEDAFVAEAGVTALVLVIVSGLLTWLLVVRRADHLD